MKWILTIQLKKTFLLMIPVCIAFAGGVTTGQEVLVSARLDSMRVLIGDQVNLHLKVEQAEGYRVIFPGIGDTLSQKIEVISKSGIDTSKDAEGKLVLKQDILITVFDTGYVTIPPQPFTLKNGDHTDTIETQPVTLQIASLPADTTLRDIKANRRTPVNLQEIFPYVLAAIGLAVLVVLIVLLVKRLTSKEKAPVRLAPAEPSWVIALRKLEKIRNEKPWIHQPVKAYYIDLTDILRIYIEGRFRITALEQTTDEILKSLRKTECHRENVDMLAGILHLADLAKFAKVIPDDAENQARAEEAILFVQQTIPAVAAVSAEETGSIQTKTGG